VPAALREDRNVAKSLIDRLAEP